MPAKRTRSGSSSLTATAKPGGQPAPRLAPRAVRRRATRASGGLCSTTATTVEPAAAAATTRGRPVSVRAGVTSSLDGTSSPSRDRARIRRRPSARSTLVTRRVSGSARRRATRDTNETAKLGSDAPPMSCGADVRHEVGPPRRARRMEPLVDGESGHPGDDLRWSEGRRREEVRARVAPSSREPVSEQHAEERDERRAEQEQERLVLPDVDGERADGRGRRPRPRSAGAAAPSRRRSGATRPSSRRSRTPRPSRPRSARAARAPRRARRRRSTSAAIGRVAVSAVREHEQCAERVQPRVRDEIADGCARRTRSRSVPREARVVGDQRQATKRAARSSGRCRTTATRPARRDPERARGRRCRSSTR